MTYRHPYGRPIVALKFIENRVILSSNEINEMLNHRDVKDRKIVVFSIVGAFRKGKSFFLDYCLRFLYAHYSSVNNPSQPNGTSNWMGDPNTPLQGFSWRSGKDRNTTGIVMWSDIFLHTMQNTGEKIAILVIDTQGLFDDQSGTAENFKIFALSSLLSSIQVLNILQQIDENQLQHLNFATNFARYIENDETTGRNNIAPFQKLTFLLRDFPYPDDYPFGIIGGSKYINEVLDINKNGQNEEVRLVRLHIKDTYEKVECCLLPHPGDTVRENKSYDGRLSGMSDRSKEEFKKAIEHLLMPNNLIIKKINGMDLTGAMMKKYIDLYFVLIKSNDIEIKSLVDGTIDNYMNDFVNKCENEYKLTKYNYEDIKEVDNISEMHKKYKSKSLEAYDKGKKMGNQRHVDNFKNLLKKRINEKFNQWKLQIMSIAKEKKKTFEAEEARKEAEEARKTAEKNLDQMTTMIALSCATNVVSSGISAFNDDSMMVYPAGLTMPDPMLGLFDTLKREKAAEEYSLLVGGFHQRIPVENHLPPRAFPAGDHSPPLAFSARDHSPPLALLAGGQSLPLALLAGGQRPLLALPPGDQKPLLALPPGDQKPLLALPPVDHLPKGPNSEGTNFHR